MIIMIATEKGAVTLAKNYKRSRNYILLWVKDSAYLSSTWTFFPAIRPLGAEDNYKVEKDERSLK